MAINRAERPQELAELGKGARWRTARLTFWEEVNVSTAWGRYLTEVEQRALRRAMDTVSYCGTSVEVGCDGGRWSKFLIENGWSVVCTDTRKEALDITKRRLPNSRCVLVDPANTTLPIESGSVELLLCIEVEPVSNQLWFIGEASRVLRPGGAVIATILNRSSLRALVHALATKGQTSLSDSPDRYEVSYTKWRKALLESGLKLVHEEGFCWPPFSRKSNSRLIPLAVKAERLLGLNKLTKISPWVAVVAQKT